ncbi:MAG: helix-turn-helix domain-containing protein [Qipengyuania pacifica]|jgi:excisionase family DNA binding protein|tara:strand:+ start:29631 stop:30479 length:849 start_codon:yes stop_codon:yes gene_type:complete
MDDILTIREVASRLKLGERTITAMLAGAELPGFKVRGQWRLRRLDFERWLNLVANGGKPQDVTAQILTSAVADIPASTELAATQQTTSVKTGSASEARGEPIEQLTKKVSQAELHRRFLEALGSDLVPLGPIDRKPLEADLPAPVSKRIRLYIFNATRPPGGRPVGEHKIQLIIPGQKRGDRGNFDQSDGRTVLLAGYAAEEDVFILWDAGLYADFAWSRNVQVKAGTIVKAYAGRIAEQERRLRPAEGSAVTETLLACRPEHLADAIIRRIELTRERMMRG